MAAARQQGRSSLTCNFTKQTQFSPNSHEILAAKEESSSIFPLAVGFPLAENSRLGFGPAGATRISRSSWITSTLRWGCKLCSYETASETPVATYYRDNTGLDYAQNRYYANTLGRFTSPDTGAANAANPQSFNRYSYAIADPINKYDPNGDIAVEVGPGGVYIPVIPVIFIVQVFGKIFGGSSQVRDGAWQTDAQVSAHAGEHSQGFWKDHEDDDENGIPDPKYLALIEDCFVRQLSFGGDVEKKPLVRRRRYQVLDEQRRPMNAIGLVVSEHHGVRFAPKGFVTGGVWSLGNRTMNSAALMDDLISTGGSGDWWSYQTFTAQYGGLVRQLAVLAGGNEYGILGIHAQDRLIEINGNQGPFANGRVTKYCDTPPI